jgi:hypothetical protein
MGRALRVDVMDERLLAAVDKVFEAAGVTYALTGRTAAALWGAPEAEREEVEVLARLAPGDVDDLLVTARAQGMGVDPGLAGLAAETGEHLTLFPSGATFVDVRPARGMHDMAALRTRLPHDAPAGRVWVCTVEETIARLLDEGTEDALLAAQRLRVRHAERLDLGYLGRRCEELGVAHLLREIAGEPTVPRPAA